MRLLTLLLLGTLLLLPVSALEIQAPAPTGEALVRMPEKTDSLEDGLWETVKNAVAGLRPDLKEAARVSLGILAAALLLSILDTVSYTGKTAVTAGVVAVASTLLLSTNSLIRLASDTVRQIGDYGTLLLPVMTAALAAQGGVAASTALHTGTALFSTILQSVLKNWMVPGTYLYLALSIGSCATGEDLLSRLAGMLKGVLSWSMKILVTVFTTYLGLTGVVSGTTDAAALKAAKVGMSTFVPVVGGALSDASEAVLVSAQLLKNAAGIYGIFAVMAIFLHPFLKIGLHYLILKLTAAVCAAFGGKELTHTVDSFAAAMGLLLGMTACGCVLVLISTVCFLKGSV